MRGCKVREIGAVACAIALSAALVAGGIDFTNSDSKSLESMLVGHGDVLYLGVSDSSDDDNGSWTPATNTLFNVAHATPLSVVTLGPYVESQSLAVITPLQSSAADTFRLSSQNVRGMTVHNDKLYVLYRDLKAVDVYSPSGTRSSSFYLSYNGTNPQGIASDGNLLYVLDDGTDSIHPHYPNGTHIASKAFVLEPSGLLGRYSDGNYKGITVYNGKLYIQESNVESFLVYEKGGTYVDTYRHSNSPDMIYPQGVAAYNNLLYVTPTAAAGYSDLIHVYKPDGTLVKKIKLHSDNDRPYGIAAYNDNLYVGDEHTARVYVYSLTKPSIDPIGDATITAGDTFDHTAAATDPDGDTLTYSLAAGPDGATINSASGAISWATDAGDVGGHSFTVSVSDGNGGTDDESFTVTVEAASNTRPGSPPGQGTVLPPVNHSPSLYTIGDATVTAGSTLVLTAVATDPDAGDTLTYSLTTKPAGATINSASGAISWACLLYTSPSPRDGLLSRMPSSA